MSATFDAQGTTNASVSNNATGHQDFTNLTVSAGSNRGVVFQIATFGVPTGVTVTWDFGGTNQACTQLVAASDPAGNAGHVELWGLVAPTAGNKTLRVAWTGGPGLIDICVDGVAYTTVDQTGGATSFPNATSANGSGASPTSVTVTSATGDAAVSCSVNTTSTFNVQNQTSVFLDNSPDHISAEGQRAAGASTVTFTATFGGGNWVTAAVSIKAAGGGGGTPVARSRLINQAVKRASFY